MKKTPTIYVNDDIPCPICGRPGATGENGKGACLKCAEEILMKKALEKLGPITLSGIVTQVRELLSTHEHPLNIAYLKHGEEKFSISFKVIIEHNGDSNKVDVQMSYRPEPDTKDSTDGIYNENQLPLFSED